MYRGPHEVQLRLTGTSNFGVLSAGKEYHGALQYVQKAKVHWAKAFATHS
jgi:hypothetical protein